MSIHYLKASITSVGKSVCSLMVAPWKAGSPLISQVKSTNGGPWPKALSCPTLESSMKSESLCMLKEFISHNQTPCMLLRPGVHTPETCSGPETVGAGNSGVPVFGA